MGTHLLWHPYFFGASPGECLTLVVACPIVCQSSTLHPSRAHRSICPRPAPARSVPSCRCSSPSPSRPPSSRPPLPCFVARPPSLGPRRSDSHRTQAPFALRPPSRSDPLCAWSAPHRSDTHRSDPHRSDVGPPSLGPPTSFGPRRVARTHLFGVTIVGPRRSEPLCVDRHRSDPIAPSSFALVPPPLLIGPRRLGPSARTHLPGQLGCVCFCVQPSPESRVCGECCPAVVFAFCVRCCSISSCCELVFIHATVIYPLFYSIFTNNLRHIELVSVSELVTGLVSTVTRQLLAKC